ncbi:hypothetical protein FHL81_24765 [Agrobacterium tumefaciens]|uniref:hypothetical protein n=1 Tax=Agrobacterium tumefaciens TaxID=358 RepID=UPI0011F294A6|nr:hypothetical protein [Agrobacterium tumefaciens]KAA1232695.1 hypothetical protein FHL81_24765 [Agrobacterium tumefaciens]
MSDYSNLFEVEDRSRSGDWMQGTGQECVDFIVRCRGIPRTDALQIVTLTKFYGQLELPELEIFVSRGRA